MYSNFSKNKFICAEYLSSEVPGSSLATKIWSKICKENGEVSQICRRQPTKARITNESNAA